VVEGAGRGTERKRQTAGKRWEGQHLRNPAGRSYYSPYTKGNFQLEQVVTGWRAKYSVLDLRLKK
jgi:hypothetical protein